VFYFILQVVKYCDATKLGAVLGVILRKPLVEALYLILHVGRNLAFNSNLKGIHNLVVVVDEMLKRAFGQRVVGRYPNVCVAVAVRLNLIDYVLHLVMNCWNMYHSLIYL
jgi:hypothetical protein